MRLKPTLQFSFAASVVGLAAAFALAGRSPMGLGSGPRPPAEVTSGCCGQKVESSGPATAISATNAGTAVGTNGAAAANGGTAVGTNGAAAANGWTAVGTTATAAANGGTAAGMTATAAANAGAAAGTNPGSAAGEGSASRVPWHISGNLSEACTCSVPCT